MSPFSSGREAFADLSCNLTQREDDTTVGFIVGETKQYSVLEVDYCHK